MNPDLSGRSPVISGSAISALVIFMALIAPLAVLGGKGLAVVLVLSGLVAIVELVRQQRISEIFSPVWLISILGGLFFWAIVSGFIGQGNSADYVLMMQLLALSVFGLAFRSSIFKFPVVNQKKLQDALLLGVCVSLIMVVMFLLVLEYDGLQLWGSNTHVPYASVRPGASILSILIWPCGLILMRRGWRLRAALFIALTLIGILPGGSAVFSLLAGCVAFVLVHFMGRLGVGVIGVAAMAFVLLLPLFILQGPTPEEIIDVFPSLSSSAQHRFYIWDFTAQKIAEFPVTGWGFNSSRAIPGGNAPAPIGDSLLPLHPHNAALQVWLELGLPGALLMSALFGYYFLVRSRKVEFTPYLAVRSAMLVTLTGNAMLSYGVWQSWWVASMWLLPSVFDAVAGSSSDRQSSDHTTTLG